jgi:hypothetical protein
MFRLSAKPQEEFRLEKAWQSSAINAGNGRVIALASYGDFRRKPKIKSSESPDDLARCSNKNAKSIIAIGPACLDFQSQPNPACAIRKLLELVGG